MAKLWYQVTNLVSEFYTPPPRVPVKSYVCIAARLQPDPLPVCVCVCLAGETRWRCACVNSPFCTVIVLAAGLKLSCWFVHTEAAETGGSQCSGDSALLSYSWWFSFMLLAFCTTGAAVSRDNESWHPDWLLHVQHGAIKKRVKRLVRVGLGGCALESKFEFRHSVKMKWTWHFTIL